MKNPLYLLVSKYGLIDATMPVARFAKDRMAERFPPADSKSLPTTSTPNSWGKPDLLSKFNQAKIDRPEFMTDSLVMTMAVSMAFAGSETTAISLSAVFYYLLKTPRCLTKLLEEIDGEAKKGAFEDVEGGLVTWGEAQKLVYLDACIKEAFRVHPAPGLPMERVVPKGGAEIAGRWIEGGTIVGVSAWVVHRRKEVFGEDVDVFRPERWLIDEGKNLEVSCFPSWHREFPGFSKKKQKANSLGIG